MKNEIKVLKLTTGEEIIAKVTKENDNLILEKPMLSLSLTTNQVGKMARTLLPWFTAGKSLKITISIDKVIAQDDPNDQSEKKYLSTTTGLTL